MSDTVKIVTETTYLYVIIDDILKSLGHRDHPACACSDSEVITTAVAAALHFGSNHCDANGFVQQTGLMPGMVEASRFSRRIHRLGELVADLFLQLGHVFKSLSESMVYRIDSFPLNSCHNIRIPRSRLFKHEQYRGRNASKRQYRRATPFYGIKVFVMTDEANRPVEYCFTPGSWAEIDGLRQMPLDLPPGSEVYLDSGFTDYWMEDELKEAENLNFWVARRKNSHRPHHPSVDFLIRHHRKPTVRRCDRDHIQRDNCPVSEKGTRCH
ncbi:transposase [Salmonirosea aquatica]|uniref:Transposase n=1 Tax=Salmonirosea aquatica TaxID=2654236 RepID=A0A7C9BDN5_9BACT|nr:transposase [Cytophagaceae bacterium SJW1-29]